MYGAMVIHKYGWKIYYIYGSVLLKLRSVICCYIYGYGWNLLHLRVLHTRKCERVAFLGSHSIKSFQTE